jgi:hypothetical protein
MKKTRGRRSRSCRVVPEHHSKQHGWFDAKKTEEKLSHGLDRTKCRDTQISQHGCKESGRVDLEEAFVGMPTSKRPQIDDVRYLRIPNKILKGASHEEIFFSCRNDQRLSHRKILVMDE